MPLEPSGKVEFTMHAVSPAFILHLCQEIDGHTPKAYLLHIKGYSFEMKEGLSEMAQANLEEAFAKIAPFLEQRIAFVAGELPRKATQ
ncbi:MAG: hypothetical protein IT292_07960 [Deltaproteobacteria bacterium]|nr:hypothetical protein [Deltaproteobacteria bacterium]